MTQVRVNAMAMGCDVVESLVVAGAWLFCLPIVRLSRLRKRRWMNRVSVLIPFGLMSAYCRYIFDYETRQYDHAETSIQIVIDTLEDAVMQEKEVTESLILLLADCYRRLAALQLKQGCVDRAAATVTRAHRILGVDALPGISDLNVDLARELSKALRTPFVVPLPQVPPETNDISNNRDVPKRHRRSAKIIPFPNPPQVET